MSTPKLIYIAGPYRAPTAFAVEQNIRAAETMGMEVLKLGAYPIIPHANTRGYFDAQPDSFMLESTLELMRRCDGVLMMKTWQDSSGAHGEHDAAKAISLPIFYSLDTLLIALRSKHEMRWASLRQVRHGNAR